ncbi:MAG: hypothetical protein WAM24_04475 [Ignavibacteriaceae bacterium]
MKSINLFKFKKQKRNLKDTLLRMTLAVSIILSVFIVSKCDFLTNVIDDLNPGGGVGPGNSSLAGTAITELFKGVAQGAGGKIGGTAAGWAMGALGLADASPDFSGQLDKIDESLQEIISQLNAVQVQLSDINNQLKILSCDLQQQNLTEETGRIDYLSTEYKSYISQAAGGERVSNADISKWVDEVMAEGKYTSKTPMAQILTTFANKLILPSSGIITACVNALPTPDNDTFGDIAYYNKVSQFTYYYYYYQAEGLFLLNEALHYKAWQVAASEDDDNYPADSVGEVCGNTDASIFCKKAGTYTNNVYNALTDQFTTAGAPYTDDYFVIQYSETTPRLWVKSLEEFSLAHGDDCNSPFNSVNNKCGVTVGRYNEGNSNITNEVYRGYTKWQFADASELNMLLSGWHIGTAGNYLKDILGFKNMNNKIILSTNTTTFSLSNSGNNQTAVIFFDTNVGKGSLDNKLFDNRKAFDLITPYQKRTASGSCYPFSSTFYTYIGKTAGTSSRWYDSYGLVEWCGGNALNGGVQWNIKPGWFESNGDDNSKQFRIPFSFVQNISCTNNRTKKNAGGVWTTCGSDFTYWFNTIVPRPETCDLSVGVICKLDYQSLSKAKKLYENNYKSNKDISY